MNKPAHMLPAPSNVILRVWKDKYGNVHRHAGPAIEHEDGCKEWFFHGMFKVWQPLHEALVFGGNVISKFPGYEEHP